MIEILRSSNEPMKIVDWINDFGLNTPTYLVKGKPFYNRYDAIESCVTEGVEWPDFRVWQQSYKMAEPEESFFDLCKKQAQAISKRFKRVRLWYSGGYDSHTMLKAFFESGLDVDEICTWRRFPGVFDSFTNIESEYIGTFDDLQHYCEQHNSKARIRVCDVTPDHFRWYCKNFIHYNKHKTLAQVLNAQHHHVMECYPELIDKETINVSGAGDVALEDDGFRFYDGFNYSHSAPNTLFFYYDESMPELTFKYAYHMRNYEYPDQKNMAKKDLGFSALNPMLAKKFSEGVDEVTGGKTISFCRKSALLINNAIGTTHGKRILIQYKKFRKKYEKERKKFLNQGKCSNGWVGALSEKHYFI